MNVETLANFLQLSLAPAIILSASGLLLLSLTNRISRPIDLIRRLIRENKEGIIDDLIKKQINILNYRAKIIRRSIMFLILNMALIVMSVFSIVISLVSKINLSILTLFFFSFGLLFLLSSIILYFYDISLTLRGIRLEIENFLKD